MQHRNLTFYCGLLSCDFPSLYTLQICLFIKSSITLYNTTSNAVEGTLLYKLNLGTMTWRALIGIRLTQWCRVKLMTLEYDSESSKRTPKWEGLSYSCTEKIFIGLWERSKLFLKKPNCTEAKELAKEANLADDYISFPSYSRARRSFTLHVHCIQVCLHCFARFEACAEWGWRNGGDNYNTSATPSPELSSVQISELSSWIACKTFIELVGSLGSGIATTRIGTQKKRFQVKHSFKASHTIINILCPGRHRWVDFAQVRMVRTSLS